MLVAASECKGSALELKRARPAYIGYSGWLFVFKGLRCIRGSFARFLPHQPHPRIPATKWRTPHPAARFAPLI